MAIIASSTCQALRELISGENIRAPKAKEKKKTALARQAPNAN